MKKILVPTDFSEHAVNAVSVAAQLALENEAELFILHVQSKKKMFDKADNQMKKAVEDLKKLGVNAKPVLLHKKLEGSILKQTKELNADLVVMGSQGQNFSDKLLGSNTDRVLRMSKVPVLVVKKELTNFNVENIVFASTFFRENEPVFEHIHEFAKAHNAKTHLLKVITPSSFENTPYSERLIDDFVKAVGLKNYTVNIFNYESAHQGILEFSKRLNADLIALTTHGKKGLSKYIAGSTAETVTDDAEIPVLSIKLPEQKSNSAILFPE